LSISDFEEQEKRTPAICAKTRPMRDAVSIKPATVTRGPSSAGGDASVARAFSL
jgi:hypothetical protein